MEKVELGSAVLYCGDCLDVMPELRAKSIKLCVTDPPYMIGMSSDAKRRINPWMNLVNAAAWYSQVYRQISRVLKNDSALWTFLNWQTLPTVQKAAFEAHRDIVNVLVWDKQALGLGLRGLRPSYELAAFMPSGTFKINDRSIPDIKRYKWTGYKPNKHSAEKPEALIS